MRSLPALALAALLGSAVSGLAQEPQGPPPRPAGPRQEGRRGGEFRELGLTDEQRQKLREIREKYPNDPEARRKAVEEVLTPEQREKLKDIRRRRREMRRAPQGEPPPQS